MIIEIDDVSVDLDEVPDKGWFHRPFSSLELMDHPEGDRIVATIEAVIQHVVKRLDEDDG